MARFFWISFSFRLTDRRGCATVSCTKLPWSRWCISPSRICRKCDL